ncbi:hypothetical protein WN943_007426 [Citrus x changshan-huyou]
MATYSATTVALESPVEASTTTNSYQINDSGGYRINSPYNSCNSMVLLSVKKRVGHWLFGLRRELVKKLHYQSKNSVTLERQMINETEFATEFCSILIFGNWFLHSPFKDINIAVVLPSARLAA